MKKKPNIYITKNMPRYTGTTVFVFILLSGIFDTAHHQLDEYNAVLEDSNT